MAKKLMQSPQGKSNITFRPPGVGGGMASQVGSRQNVHRVKGPAANLPASNARKTGKK